MGDLFYERKFKEMQKYIPFLERVIEKLKNNDQDKPRKAQLEKMQMLHNLLNNKQKKLKIDTLLKCESVLKKLHAKIEKSDELSPPMTLNKPSPTTTTTNTSSDVPKKLQTMPYRSSVPPHPPSSTSSSSSAKFVTRSNLIEINTCPASPTQFGDVDFCPPVEIPTERRCSPLRSVITTKAQSEGGKPIPTISSVYQNHSTDYYNSNNSYQQAPQQQEQQHYHHHYYQQQHHHHPPLPAPSHQHHQKHLDRPSHVSRWSDKRDWPPEPQPVAASSNPSSLNKSWSSSSSSTVSSSNYRQHKNEPKKVYSSEEENWDDPEDTPPQPPKAAAKPVAPPIPPSSTTSSLSHSQHRDSNSGYQHRHHEKSKKHARDLATPMPEVNLDKDFYQNKLFHDTIFKYKKPDSPSTVFNPFMNPPPPEMPPALVTSISNIFNRLGDKVEQKVDFENFRIEVKNDKMKLKPTAKPAPPLSPPPISPPPPPPPPVIPIDEVLKSPPLSADDIDDLLNESLEAALGKTVKAKSIELKKGEKETALETVRKKLAMISKPSSSGMESPPPSANKGQDEREPFYRRGQTPTKKTDDALKHVTPPAPSSHRELFKPPTPIGDSTPKSPPKSPVNPIDPVIQRLALKYNPHRRRDSVAAMPQEKNEKKTIQSPPIRDLMTGGDRLALKYNPHPRRDSTVSPLRTADPRVGKMLGQHSPLVATPINNSPGTNVLANINSYDPRFRNVRMDSTPVVPFCTPIPYTSPIPSLLDINVQPPVLVSNGPHPKPLFGVPPSSRLDPRTHKLQATIYADKFNPERNDLTERMKYLESKKKKPPEPKTYGEYKQSKCRQQAAEEATKAATVADPVPATSTVVSAVPSTLDKMYRNADYGTELGGSMQSFKIPKKPKPEEPKIEPTKEEPVGKIEVLGPKSEESGKKKDESQKKLHESAEPTNADDEMAKTIEEPVKSAEKSANKLDAPKVATTESEDSPEKKPKESAKTKPLKNESTELDSCLDVSKSDDSILIEDSEDESENVVKRSPGRPKRILKKGSPDKHKTETQDEKEEDKKKSNKEDPKEESKVAKKEESKVAKKGESKVAKKEEKEEETEEESEEETEEETDDEKEEEKEEIKPRKILTRRSTIARDRPNTEVHSRGESLSPSLIRCRSPSEMFAPTTDNSIVSTQNIIAGKRRTRTTINFNEKTTKKPITPKAAVASPATTPKTRGKPGPKTNAKKSPPIVTRTRRHNGGKLTSDDGQICAVSSTTSQGGDADDSHNDNPIEPEDVGSTEEPTSSGSKPQTPAADADENEKKQEWLEGFLKSIVDPTTNKDRILDMLQAVLDEKKLQQVKDILYSPEDEDRDAAVNVKKPAEQTKPRAVRTKKNELDRLNEDIRDMFICQGVVTATGRRMCTLAKVSSNEKPPAKPREQPKDKKSARLKDDTSSGTPSPIGKRNMRRAKVLISPLNMRTLRSRGQKESSTPEMPVLVPNTPIKLPGEDEEANEPVKVSCPAKKKPGPKSKRSSSFCLESDDDDEDDVIQLVHLKKKIKGEDNDPKSEKIEKKEAKVERKEKQHVNVEQKEEKQAKVARERKEKQMAEEKMNEEKPAKVGTERKEKQVAEVKKMEENQVQVEKEEEKEKKDKKKKHELPPKNINPDWHSMSEYASCCVICKEKARFIAPHYLSAHNDSEVYTSRLPPAVMNDIKLNKGNRALYSMSKKSGMLAFHYRCPFCDLQSTSSLRCWLEHFTIHTGEYQYKCSGCFKGMNGCSHLMEHIKRCCPDAKRINRDPVCLRGNMIKAFVCYLCNFIQIVRSGVVRHLKLHHNLEDDESIGRIIEVKLIDSAGVTKMDEIKEPTEVLASGKDTLVLPSPPTSNTTTKESNMEVFLSRELASPTSDVLTERLKSIDQDEGITSDSSVNAMSPFKAGQTPVAVRMTIAEKLTQRFKNIEKQNLLDDEKAEEVRREDSTPIEEHLRETYVPNRNTTPMQMEIEEVEPPKNATVPPSENSPTADNSLNESGMLVIDEQEGDKSTVYGDGSESEWADDNDEDDNENWEDIEITETKGTSQKDKTKNKSIFQTLSRLYASIAPGSKKLAKEKEKKKTDALHPPGKSTGPQSAAPITAAAGPSSPPEISNLSELLPDTPGDSLDMLLATNFNCLEGDGTSFPHLDLNDLDSSIFLLPEEQNNLQDAIAMATELDQIKYDVLGNPLPAITTAQTLQTQISSTASVQRIGNVGFSLSGNTLKYYCMVTACTFLFSDHPDGLQNHFLLEHPSLKWNGYCHTCRAQICLAGGREIQHILDSHLKPKVEEQPGDKPRIKFRRLTGDILSTGKQQPPSPPSLQPPAPATTSLLLQRPPKAKASKLCLTSLLQSEPKAMIKPTPPPAFENDIPLYKNVSKEFTITGVAEGVTDDELRNLVLNQSESTSGGLQISQVISLNDGAKSVMSGQVQFADLIPTVGQHNSPLQNDSGRPSQTKSPIPFQSINLPGFMTCNSQRNSPVPSPVHPPVKTHTHSFKCCANQCQFYTNLRSAMNEHILLHMRTDNDRGALKCHNCTFLGRSITDYFQHMTQVHLRPKSTSPCLQTNDLTQKIQDILRATANPTSKPIEEEQDPLAITESNEQQEKSFSEKLRKVAEEIVNETGMPDTELWKCPYYPECKKSVVEWDFLAHVAYHMTSNFPTRSPGTTLHCPHCAVNYQRAGILKAHMKTHARHQYFCYVCCATASNFHQAQKHFNESHSRSNQVQAQPLIPDEPPGKISAFFIVNSDKLAPMEVMQFGEKLLAEWERKKSLTKTHFKPNEQYLLPLQPIFNNQVFCSVCNYKTKVRTNMFRHLQLHKQEVDVGSVDPINPVPCLEKNEKHFDKMTNLACSSNATPGSAKSKESSVKIPIYVPDMRRYVCGHPGCTYLTITDQMLRSHLNALHSGEKGYQCPHCQEDICKKTMCAERVVQHLKFHGLKIYQCGECDYLHYTKHVVERHVNEKHSTVPFINLVTYDRTDGEVNKTIQLIVGKAGSSAALTSSEAESSESATTPSVAPPNKNKWECAICKHQTTTWNQMISHANSMHRAKHQYTCVHCPYGSAHLSHIMDHIDTKHPTKTREAKYVFYKINETPQDKAADTRPLWSRDDPKRVRSIRGILMENEEDAERTKQSLTKAGVDLDDEDDDVEIVQVIESESAMKPGILGCFHCDFKSEEMTALNQHWKTKHWHTRNFELVPKLPFFFRVHSILKCPLCSYVGDYVSLQLHANNKHGQRVFYASDPKLPNTCGHCPFNYPPKRLEVLTRHYHREHKPTDVKNLSSSLLKSVLALGECQVYMQCYFCAEICADKTAIIEHERERHSSSNFRYKQIKDEVIYRCGMCQYSSTNELATLRHMTDHFGGFMHCHFCLKDQSSFNSYMQHCYATHRNELKGFKEIYTLADITAFLGQMLLIFPNGLIVNKRNLMHTQYGSTERILAMYHEICKKALEPPIPPLCMARLMARKLTEARESTPLLPPPPVPVTAKRIAKRRSTVAISAVERGLSDFLMPAGPQRLKKRKSSISEDRPLPPAPLFSTITSRANHDFHAPIGVESNATTAPDETSVGVSFYGKQPESIDLSKIYTQIAIGDKYAPVSVKKFALLFKINAKVVVDKMSIRKYKVKKRSGMVSKPCPASKKKYV